MTQKKPYIRWGLWLTILVCSAFAHQYANSDSRIVREIPYIDGVFFVIYAGLAAVVLFAFGNWLKFEGTAKVRKGLETIKVVAPPLPNIRSLDAGRKLRQAEKEFVTLKNLHDNGLITHEMFLKRKAELKAALDNNELFNKDDDFTTPK